MRWALAVVSSIVACTAPNPEFGAESSSSSSGADPGTSSSSSEGSSESADVTSSSESGTIAACGEPDDRVTSVRIVGEQVGAGATYGAIRFDENGIAIDCNDPCTADIPIACIPLSFEVSPPLWEGWVPPTGCFRFQWVSSDLETADELRIGRAAESDQLIVLAAPPLVANAYDIEVKPKEHCSCEDRQCCPENAGDYGLFVHADQDVVLDDDMPVHENVGWMGAVYRVEHGGSEIVPDCTSPVRLQFRAYRTQ